MRNWVLLIIYSPAGPCGLGVWNGETSNCCWRKFSLEFSQLQSEFRQEQQNILWDWVHYDIMANPVMCVVYEYGSVQRLSSLSIAMNAQEISLIPCMCLAANSICLRGGYMNYVFTWFCVAFEWNVRGFIGIAGEADVSDKRGNKRGDNKQTNISSPNSLVPGGWFSAKDEWQWCVSIWRIILLSSLSSISVSMMYKSGIASGK